MEPEMEREEETEPTGANARADQPPRHDAHPRNDEPPRHDDIPRHDAHPRNDDPPRNDAPPHIVKAEIQVGSDTVPYERAGRGAPVLLLVDGVAPEAWPGATFEALARERRVYRPTTPIPRCRDEAERWIRGLVEALGLREPDVVAEAELAPLLARLVRRNGGLVGQVLFLAPFAGGAALPEDDTARDAP